MKTKIWFYDKPFDSRSKFLYEAHRKAYEKSLKCDHAVKVHSGTYYYKGYEISNDGGRECPWNYNKVGASDFDREAAETKKLAMEYIDNILKDEIDLCDLMCN